MTKDDVQEEKINMLKEKSQNNSDRIEWLEQHYSTFNSEMGEVKNDIKWVITMVKWEIGIVLSGFGFLSTLIIKHILGA